MQVELVNLDGRRSRYKIVIDRLPAIIGRSEDAGVRLLELEISRRHCEIYLRDGMPAIHDLGSTNGTYVNGRNVTDSPLMPGDRLQLGRAVFFVYYVPDGEVAKTSRAGQAAPYQIDPYESYHVFRMKLRGWPCSTN